MHAQGKGACYQSSAVSSQQRCYSSVLWISLTAELMVLILSMMTSSACRTMDSAFSTPVLSTLKMNSS